MEKALQVVEELCDAGAILDDAGPSHLIGGSSETTDGILFCLQLDAKQGTVKFNGEDSNVLLLYEDGNLTKPVKPHVGMFLGRGSAKVFGDWLRMYLLLGHNGKVTAESKSLKKRIGTSNTHEYGWQCTDANCKWNVRISRNSDTQIWSIKSIDEHCKECESTADPSEREFVFLMQSINWAEVTPRGTNVGDNNKTLGMNDIMKIIQDKYGIGLDKCFYRKIWNARKKVFGLTDTIGTMDPIISTQPQSKISSTQREAFSPSHSSPHEFNIQESQTYTFYQSNDCAQSDAMLIMMGSDEEPVNVCNEKIPEKSSETVDINDILYYNRNKCTPRRPFLGMNLGHGHPKLYGDWLRMCFLFDKNGQLLEHPKSLIKSKNTTNSKQYGWACSDSKCHWRVNIVWRKRRMAWFIKEINEHCESCDSKMKISQSVIANILQSQSVDRSRGCASISDLMTTAEIIGLDFNSDKNYSKFWHAKNILLKRKEAPIMATIEAKHAAKLERKKRKDFINPTLTNNSSITSIFQSIEDNNAEKRQSPTGYYHNHLPTETSSDPQTLPAFATQETSVTIFSEPVMFRQLDMDVIVDGSTGIASEDCANLNAMRNVANCQHRNLMNPDDNNLTSSAVLFDYATVPGQVNHNSVQTLYES